jgi:hypothetical protein
MDPDQALADARDALDEYRAGERKSTAMPALQRAADAFEALHSWITSGGFLPRDWRPEAP